MLIVYNPATGEEIGRVAKHTANEVKAAVDRTCAAFPDWSSKLAKERSDILRRWHDAVKADKETFAELLCRENGKCLSEARGEIDYGLGFIEWYAEEAKRVYGDTIPTHDRNANVMVTKEAIGVYPSKAQAHASIASYIHGFYNAARLHSALGYSSPNDYAKQLKQTA